MARALKADVEDKPQLEQQTDHRHGDACAPTRLFASGQDLSSPGSIAKIGQ